MTPTEQRDLLIFELAAILERYRGASNPELRSARRALALVWSQTIRCPKCEQDLSPAELLDGEACPYCKLVI